RQHQRNEQCCQAECSGQKEQPQPDQVAQSPGTPDIQKFEAEQNRRADTKTQASQHPQILQLKADPQIGQGPVHQRGVTQSTQHVQDEIEIQCLTGRQV